MEPQPQLPQQVQSKSTVQRRGHSQPVSVRRDNLVSRPIRPSQREGSMGLSSGGGGGGGSGHHTTTTTAAESNGTKVITSTSSSVTSPSTTSIMLHSGAGFGSGTPERFSSSSGMGGALSLSATGVQRGLTRSPVSGQGTATSGDSLRVMSAPRRHDRHGEGSAASTRGGRVMRAKNMMSGSRASSSGPSHPGRRRLPSCASGRTNGVNDIKVKIYKRGDQMVRLVYVNPKIDYEVFLKKVAERCDLAVYSPDGEFVMPQIVLNYVDSAGDTVLVDQRELVELQRRNDMETIKFQVEVLDQSMQQQQQQNHAFSPLTGSPPLAPRPHSSASMNGTPVGRTSANGGLQASQLVSNASSTARVGGSKPAIIKSRNTSSTPQQEQNLTMTAPTLSCASPKQRPAPSSLAAASAHGNTISNISSGSQPQPQPVVVSRSRDMDGSMNNSANNGLSGSITPARHINPADSMETFLPARDVHRSSNTPTNNATARSAHGLPTNSSVRNSSTRNSTNQNPRSAGGNVHTGSTASSASGGSLTLNLGMRSPQTPLQEVTFEEIEADPDRVQWKSVGIVGRGQFGTVYEGELDDGSLVAVKVIEVPCSESGHAKDPNAMRKLMREINMMRTLYHPNIVSYIHCQVNRTGDSRISSSGEGSTNRLRSSDFANDEPVVSTAARNRRRSTMQYQIEIIMELCQEGNLTNFIAHSGGALKVVVARRVLRDVLLGLAFLHGQGYVHRDVKADNVLMSTDGVAKLSDFGCSRRIAAAATMGSTDAGMVDDVMSGNHTDESVCKTLAGTPLNMAPEVIRSSATCGYGTPADVWSFGCLVICAFGRLPWTVTPTCNLLSIMQIIADSDSLPHGLPSNAQQSFMDLLVSCFQRQPENRPSVVDLLAMDWMTCPDSELTEPLWGPMNNSTSNNANSNAYYNNNNNNNNNGPLRKGSVVLGNH